MTLSCLSCAHLDPVTLTCAEGHQPTVEPVASPFPWLPGRTVRVIAPEDCEDCEEWEEQTDA